MSSLFQSDLPPRLLQGHPAALPAFTLKFFQGLQYCGFHCSDTLAQVPRQTLEMEPRSHGMMAKAFHVQHGATERSPAKTGGADEQRLVHACGMNGP